MEENKLNLIVEETEETLKKELSWYKYNEQYAYQLKKLNLNANTVLIITSNNLSCPFITSSVINDVKKVCESSKWKDKMFYGIDTQIVFDKEIGKERIIPSLSIFIEK